jgi:hypothetical protein
LIAAVIQIPALHPLGVVAFVMVLFIWLPLWAYFNWSAVVSDIPATCALSGMAIMATLTMQLDIWWEDSEARETLRLMMLGTHFPSMEIWFTPWPVKVLDALPECVLFGILMSWDFVPRWISNRFTRTNNRGDHLW